MGGARIRFWALYLLAQALLIPPTVRGQPLVLVDASRDGGVWWFPQPPAGTVTFDPNRDHQGKALADYLRSEGFQVTELPRPFTVSSELLLQFQFVIAAA